MNIGNKVWGLGEIEKEITPSRLALEHSKQWEEEMNTPGWESDVNISDHFEKELQEADKDYTICESKALLPDSKPAQKLDKTDNDDDGDGPEQYNRLSRGRKRYSETAKQGPKPFVSTRKKPLFPELYQKQQTEPDTMKRKRVDEQPSSSKTIVKRYDVKDGKQRQGVNIEDTEKETDGCLKPIPSLATNEANERDDDDYWTEILLKRRQVQTNLKNLNMDDFQSWLNAKSSSTDVTALMMMNILSQGQTQELLNLKISELRSDIFLLNRRSTKELYLSLIEIIKDIIREERWEIDRKYEVTFNFLEDLKKN